MRIITSLAMETSDGAMETKSKPFFTIVKVMADDLSRGNSKFQMHNCMNTYENGEP